MRDVFSHNVKENLAKRVGYKCSNPSCKCLTSGPQVNPDKSIIIGVASHITAASADGPRYDNTLTSEERGSSENGIWFCQNCGKLVDNDTNRYTVELLRDWKMRAEHDALIEIEGRAKQQINPRILVFQKLERLMGDLLQEMRTDLTKHPLRREFILLKKEWCYNSKDGLELLYFYNEHQELENKIRILENNHLVLEITYNNTKRYLFSEELVTYLTGEGHV
jgi:hypothetical protein